MPKSWLAEAKSIHDLGSWYYLPKPGVYDEKQDMRKEAKWLEQLRKPLPVEPQYVKFFGSRMHDSWVMGIERSPDVLRVRLDNCEADMYAFNLAGVLDMEPVPSQWPVDLLLHDPRYVRGVRHDPQGNLRFAEWENIRSCEPQKGDQFLHDWFFEQDGRLQWIADIWSWEQGRGKLSTSMWLLVDCARATAEDYRSPAIKRAYGPGGLTLWEHAHANFKGLWGIYSMRDFLTEGIASFGLKPKDFVGQSAKISST